MRYNIEYIFHDSYCKNTIRTKFTTSLNKTILEGMKSYSEAVNQPISKMIEIFFDEMLSSKQSQTEFYNKLCKYKGIE